ncbi:Uma2 family endonuclease [Methylomonas sp. SURF-1]|uniref:Uma2 family endonuclease n=1 Tax=Methylomonas aurea TaxID=2952224 RepID=A0ABT1ULR0_9GAMM|nr:Uma2 family endonuclease [Methylomonas sp. SURF-1]MCQ8183042.1 Uma2 family endonuclease [Methylomonas sp. SURF-1]
MSVPLAKPPRMTAEEYLAMEMSSQVRHEYVAGEIFAMTGGSDSHNLIAGNLYILFREHLRGTSCRVFMSDLKLKVEAADAYLYPDLMVTCETAKDSHFREQPELVVEVLSDSTAKYDREHKRRMYQTLASLQEYVLVAQSCMDVRVYRRTAEGWDMAIYTDGAKIPLQSIELDIPVDRIYESVWN